MINPQSLTLIQAYEPYLSVEQVLFLDASRNGYLHTEFPDSDHSHWFWMFTFDSQHKEVQVMCKGFETVQQARACLFFVLWNASVTLRVGGVTDVTTEHDYAVLLAGLWENNG